MTAAKFHWSPASISRLRDLLEVEKYSASQAALALCREFGTDAVSRNSVIGKASRSGIIIANGFRAKSKQLGHLQAERLPVPKPAPRKPAKAIPAAAIAAPAPEAIPAPSSAHVGLMGLTEWNCHWPVAEDPWRFCGAVAAFDRPYCQFHLQIAYVPRKRAKDADLFASV